MGTIQYLREKLGEHSDCVYDSLYNSSASLKKTMNLLEDISNSKSESQRSPLFTSGMGAGGLRRQLEATSHSIQQNTWASSLNKNLQNYRFIFHHSLDIRLVFSDSSITLICFAMHLLEEGGSQWVFNHYGSFFKAMPLSRELNMTLDNDNLNQDQIINRDQIDNMIMLRKMVLFRTGQNSSSIMAGQLQYLDWMNKAMDAFTGRESSTKFRDIDPRDADFVDVSYIDPNEEYIVDVIGASAGEEDEDSENYENYTDKTGDSYPNSYKRKPKNYQHSVPSDSVAQLSALDDDQQNQKFDEGDLEYDTELNTTDFYYFLLKMAPVVKEGHDEKTFPNKFLKIKREDYHATLEYRKAMYDKEGLPETKGSLPDTHLSREVFYLRKMIKQSAERYRLSDWKTEMLGITKQIMALHRSNRFIHVRACGILDSAFEYKKIFQKDRAKRNTD